MNFRRTLIGMSVVAMIVAPAALAQSPTTIQDSHDRADVPRTALVQKVIQDSHDRADVPRSTLVVASPSSFDWGDAAIGAVSGMGFALVLAGLGLLLMSQRTRTQIATR